MWIVFALLGRALWAATSILEKILITTHISPIVYLIFSSFMGLLALWNVPFNGLIVPDFKVLMMALIAGALYIGASLSYLKALKFDEVSRLVPIWQFTPIFVLMITGITIGEKLSYLDYFAFMLLVLGGFMISLRRVDRMFKLNKGFWLMVLSSVLHALLQTAGKYVYQNIPYNDGFAWIRIGAFLATLPILFYPPVIKTFVQTVKLLNNRVKLILIVTGIIDITGLALFNLAISTGSVSLVSAMGGTLSLFTIIFALLLSSRYPKLLKEEINKKIIAVKITSVIFISIGVYLISVYHKT